MRPRLARTWNYPSTPSANLDRVHSIYTTWERSDYSSAVSAHPEIEFVDGSDSGSLLEYRYAVGRSASSYPSRFSWSRQQRRWQCQNPPASFSNQTQAGAC